jgi:hypothetical protein
MKTTLIFRKIFCFHLLANLDISGFAHILLLSPCHIPRRFLKFPCPIQLRLSLARSAPIPSPRL